MLVLPYLALIAVPWLCPSVLKRMDAWWQNLLKEVPQSRPIAWFEKISLYKDYDYLCVLFLMAVCWNGTTVADFANYQNAYQMVSLGLPYSFLGEGWYWIMNLGLMLGISYRALKMLVAGFSFFLIAKTIRNLDVKAPARLLVWSMVLIFPAFLDCVQVRYLAATAIAFYGMPWLRTPSWKHAIAYLALCLAAFLIHTTAIVFASFLLVWVVRRWFKPMAVLMVLCFILLLVSRAWLIDHLSVLSGLERIQRYLLEGQPVGTLGFCCLFFLLAGLVILSGFLVHQASETFLAKSHNLVSMVFCLNCMAMVILPLCLFDLNFIRLQRPLWILNDAICALWLTSKHSLPAGKAGLYRKGLIAALWFLNITANLYLISVYTFDINLAFLL